MCVCVCVRVCVCVCVCVLYLMISAIFVRASTLIKGHTFRPTHHRSLWACAGVPVRFPAFCTRGSVCACIWT